MQGHRNPRAKKLYMEFSTRPLHSNDGIIPIPSTPPANLPGSACKDAELGEDSAEKVVC